MFLALDLGESPEVVVLDRERLKHLQAEVALTGNELALRTSALLLEGGVRHGESSNELHFTFSLRRLGEKTGPTVRVVGPADNVKQARRLLAQAILQQCNVAAREQTAADAKTEAAAFSERAAILGAHGEREAAARCAEAAATLFPSPEYRWQAAGSVALRSWCRRRTGSQSRAAFLGTAATVPGRAPGELADEQSRADPAPTGAERPRGNASSANRTQPGKPGVAQSPQGTAASLPGLLPTRAGLRRGAVG